MYLCYSKYCETIVLYIPLKRTTIVLLLSFKFAMYHAVNIFLSIVLIVIQQFSRVAYFFRGYPYILSSLEITTKVSFRYLRPFKCKTILQ